jgi:hypothetical protein
LGNLDQLTGQQVLKFELYFQLADHNEMMRSWAGDVEWLWRKTRENGASHPWFDIIGRLDRVLNPITSIRVEPEGDASLEEMEETLQEQAFLEDADDGEFADDDQVNEMLDGGGWETEPE